MTTPTLPYNANKTNWYLDIEEKWSSATNQVYTAGPFMYSSNMTLEEFMDDVNDALAQVNSTRASGQPQYEMTVQIFAPTRANLNTLNNFMIRYNILQTDSVNYSSWGSFQGFRIAFRDGPHGYRSPWFDEGDTPRGNFAFTNYSDTRAAMLPYASEMVTIEDSPPVAPNISIVPYSGVSNRLLLLLNTGTGEFTASPVVIKQDDIDKILQIYSSQNNTSIANAQLMLAMGDLKLNYKTDDPISRYEVFRTTSRPSSYEDFGGNNTPYKVVTGKIRLDKETSAAHLVDKIIPNTKYYYCFRAIDVHNNVSNPTHVFEVEMVDNQGQIYMILNTFMFTADVSDKTTKPGRRYIYIEPALRNVTYDGNIAAETTESTIPGGGGAILGPQTDNCWEKTFKVRLTSKKTGKKVDINILCKNTGVLNP